jgi:hypothetical protein
MNEKRKIRGYKILDKPYEKAKKRAIREKKTLASMIEQAVVSYASGEKFISE